MSEEQEWADALAHFSKEDTVVAVIKLIGLLQDALLSMTNLIAMNRNDWHTLPKDVRMNQKQILDVLARIATMVNPGETYEAGSGRW